MIGIDWMEILALAGIFLAGLGSVVVICLVMHAAVHADNRNSADAK